MAAAGKPRHVRRLVLIGVVIVALWSVIGWKNYEPNLGLDLQGGISVVLAPKEGERVDEGALEQAVNIIRNRVDALGVAEPDITRQGNNVLVQLPGIKEQERALRLIGTTAKLRFRSVVEPVTIQSDPAERKKAKLPTCGEPSTYARDQVDEEGIYCVKNPTLPPENWPMLKLGPARLEGTDVKGASAQLDPQGAQGWFVSLDLTGEGSDKFARVTGELACNPQGDPRRQLAIVLDRVVESHPEMGDEVQCNQGIKGGQATISGSFTEDDAKELALVLRYGALPVELAPLTTTTISPTLGRESLRSGLLAAVIGISIVFVYVLFFYRLLGSIIWIGIALHALVTLGIIIVLGQTAGFALTLAGIAGLIVSLGVASDSFIVYFERIKDEVIGGRTMRTAIERAWPSARRTIINADIVTALAAIVLYFLAVGSVRGFALMLGLSTLLDLIISFYFMHPLVSLLSRTRLLARSKTLGTARAAPTLAGGSR